MANLPGVRVALTLPLDIRERLGQLAAAERRSMSQQVVWMVEQADLARRACEHLSGELA